MPDAARISDHHLCPKILPGPVPHIGGPVFSGSMNVIIGHLPAARAQDRSICVPLGPLDQIRKGSTTVLVNHRSAARRTDPMNHGGIIVAGCPTVIIGDSPQSFTFRAAARQGTPFCEECERARERQSHDDIDDDESLAPLTDAATLDDPQPPPGAACPRAALAQAVPTPFSLAALAAQPNLGDGANDLRCASRAAVTWNFYLEHFTDLKPSKIESHVRCVDVASPVQVVEIPPLGGGKLYQRGVPGGRLGQYFALDPDVSPESLGTSSLVYPWVDGVRVTTAVPRDYREVEFPDEAPALGLQSVAAPANDTWSMPGDDPTTQRDVACAGGGTQILVPHKFHP